MKKINLLLPLLAVFSLTMVSPVLAIDTVPSIAPVPSITIKPSVTPTSVKNKEVKKEIQNSVKTETKQIREEAKEEIKTIKAENKDLRTTKLDSLKQKRAESIYKAIRNEFVKRFDVLVKTKDKITSRIAEKESQGKDMTAAKARLADFTKYQTTYNNDMATFEAKYKEIATAKPSVLIASLKTVSTQLKTDLNSMRQVLVDSLKLVVKAK
jgi:exonuclease VII large subunit